MRRLEGPRTSGSRVLMPSEGCGCCPEVPGASEVLQQQEGGTGSDVVFRNLTPGAVTREGMRHDRGLNWGVGQQTWRAGDRLKRDSRGRIDGVGHWSRRRGQGSPQDPGLLSWGWG